MSQQKRWKAEELAMLRQLVGNCQTPNWVQIGETLNRTPMSCLKSWNYYFKNLRKRRDWTLQEDGLLRQLVKPKRFRWIYVATYFPDRTICELKRRWKTLRTKYSYKVEDSQPLFDEFPEDGLDGIEFE
jgi:hypothetical protein